MKFKQNQSLTPNQSPHRLWLSFIITLFIFATSVSAYFLVKNSQDIRKSASDPYQNDCICLYNSTCSAAGMKPCEGSCSPACSAPQICCQPITNDLCTQGERYCVDANRIATCKPDRSGYTISNCTNGTSCNSQQKLCIADPTPNPAATCQQNGGSCMSVSCASVYMQSIAGSCSNPSYNCCKTIQQFACDAGEKECVNNTTRRYCNSERTAWITASCPSNSTCQNGTCVFPCQGTCYANSSCSAIGKYQAVGQCTNSSSVCCQDAPASCQGSCYTGASCSALGKLAEAGNCPGTNTVCCKETSTPTCEGTCYTNTSCSAIGKVPASGTCRYDTSICCKEATTTTPTCEGTCYTNTSCTAIGKVPAGGTCLNSTSICCKEADSSTPVVTTGTNCEGSCYDASSCDAIGKRQASGSCAASVWQVFNGLVCCKENVLAAPGSLGLGDPCIDDSECATGNCNNWARYEAIGPGVSYANYQCLSSEADQQVMVDASNKAGMVAVGIEVALMGGYLLTPAIQSIIGLAGGSLSALPTAAYSYATATIATAPAWAQTTLSVGTVVTGWAGVIAGQYACTTNNQTAATRAACDAYLAEMIGNPADMLSLATATGGLLDDAGKAINRGLNHQFTQNTIQPLSANNFQAVGGGFFGDTYIDPNTGYLVKVYKKPDDPNNVFQMNFYKQYSDQAPGITYRGSLPNGTGFAQEFFDNTTPLSKYTGTLTNSEINQAVQDLATIQNISGIPHGDLAFPHGLHGGNTLIQTLPDGSHKVIIVDYAGTHDYLANFTSSGYDPNAHMQSELNMFQQGLEGYLSPEDHLKLLFGSQAHFGPSPGSSSTLWDVLGPSDTTPGRVVPIQPPPSSSFDWGFTVP